MQPGQGNLAPDLWDAARRGEEEALVQVLLAYRKDIHRFARTTCEGGDVQDAVQESLWILYRKVGGIRTVGAVAGWLFTVVRRECIRLARRGRSGSRVDLEHLEDDLRFSEMPQEELRLDLARAMGSLPAHYREVVMRVDVRGVPVDEAAHALGLTRESAKARLHRARRMLRQILIR